MALDAPSVWGKQVADAIKALRPTAGSPVTDAQLEAIWAAIKGVDTTQLGQADVAPGNFSVNSPTDGPLPVSGTGGPVS